MWIDFTGSDSYFKALLHTAGSSLMTCDPCDKLANPASALQLMDLSTTRPMSQTQPSAFAIYNIRMANDIIDFASTWKLVSICMLRCSPPSEPPPPPAHSPLPILRNGHQTKPWGWRFSRTHAVLAQSTISASTLLFGRDATVAPKHGCVREHVRVHLFSYHLHAMTAIQSKSAGLQ